MDQTTLAWIVPLAFATFSLAFLTLRLYGAGSYWWVAAFALVGTGFAITIVPNGELYAWKSLSEDSFFMLGVAALAYGVATRYERRPDNRVMAVIMTGGLAGAAYSQWVLGSVAYEIIIVQSACVLMMLEVARVIRRHLRHAADKLLFALVIAFSVSLLAQNLFLWLEGHALTPHTWRDSSWAYMFQLTGSVTGILFAVTLLVSLGLDMIERLRSFSRTDPLSGVLNRRGFDEAVGQSESDGAVGAAIVLLDVDLFKRINDQYGHAAGDLVITHMGALLSNAVGKRGIVSRLGGEEFAVLLRRCDAAQAIALAEELRAALSAHHWPEPLRAETITASFGVSLVAAGETLAIAQRRADENLYRAKREGRNRVMGAHGTIALAS